MLELNAVKVRYDKVPALRGVTLTVDDGEVVALIGANGAGKSTTLRAIQGLVKVASGQITWQGQALAGAPPHQVVRRGIAHCPEGRQVFPEMTVAENLNMGGMVLTDAKRRQTLQEYAYQRFPRLYERRKQLAGSLSGGEQQMLAIGRALMADPKLLMLDEPSMGLAPILVEKIFEMIDSINQEGISILLVEQNAALALEHSRRAYVIENGSIGAAGPSDQLLHDDYVCEAYLGL